MKSCLYEGDLCHQRFVTPQRTFSYTLFLVYLDLEELSSVFSRRWLWSTDKPNLAWFRRSDHYGDSHVPLDTAIRDLVEQRTGTRPQGPIRLLTHLRYAGYCLNPVSFYYCFHKEDNTVETFVAEVNNTPWGEQHMYVLPQTKNRGAPDAQCHTFPKAFHVSPFLSMNMDYIWRFGVPGDTLSVSMDNVKGEQPIFGATLSLKRRPMTGFQLARVLLLYPHMTFKVLFAIYFQALCLWLRGARFFPHPRTTVKPPSHAQ